MKKNEAFLSVVILGGPIGWIFLLPLYDGMGYGTPTNAAGEMTNPTYQQDVVMG